MLTVKEYIKQVLSDIREAKDEEQSFNGIRGVIEFDIATTATQSGGAGLKVAVLGMGGEMGGKLESGTVSRVKFEVQTKGAINPSGR